jgi:hypothetical protein
LEEADFGKYKCEATNIVGKSDTVFELIDAVDPIEAVKTKHNKHHSHESNFMSRNRVDGDYNDDQLDEQNDSYQYYNSNSDMNNEGELENDDKSKTKKKNNLKKYSNKNKTLSKYQLNKANRLADPDNRLQKVKGM